jgi:hypothetical protein
LLRGRRVPEATIWSAYLAEGRTMPGNQFSSTDASLEQLEQILWERKGMSLTLYKTASPETSAEYPEFYDLTLKTVRAWGKVENYLIIIHGWWDENDNEVKEERQVLNTAGNDAFSSYADAFQQFTHYKQQFANDGFVHAFSKDMLNGNDVYEFIGPS